MQFNKGKQMLLDAARKKRVLATRKRKEADQHDAEAKNLEVQANQLN